MGMKFGGLHGKREKSKLADINSAVTRPTRLHDGCHISTRKIIGGFKFGAVLVKLPIR